MTFFFRTTTAGYSTSREMPLKRKPGALPNVDGAKRGTISTPQPAEDVAPAVAPSAEGRTSAPVPKRVLEVIEYLEAHPNRAVVLETAASALGLEPGHFTAVGLVAFTLQFLGSCFADDDLESGANHAIRVLADKWPCTISVPNTEDPGASAWEIYDMLATSWARDPYGAWVLVPLLAFLRGRGDVLVDAADVLLHNDPAEDAARTDPRSFVAFATLARTSQNSATMGAQALQAYRRLQAKAQAAAIRATPFFPLHPVFFCVAGRRRVKFRGIRVVIHYLTTHVQGAGACDVI
jgi:hypothetical protein